MKKFFVILLAGVMCFSFALPVSAEAGRRRHGRNPDLGDVAKGLGVMVATGVVAAVVVNAIQGSPYKWEQCDQRYDRYNRQRVRQSAQISVRNGKVDWRYRWNYSN